MSEEKPEEDEPDPHLELEYQECGEVNRFNSGIRFSFFGGFTTFFAILIGGYAYVWTTKEEVFGTLKSWLIVFVAFFGLLAAFVGWLVEVRNTALNRACVERLKALEAEMNKKEKKKLWRIHGLLDASKTKTPVFGVTAAHGVAIAILYLSIDLVWLAIFLFSVYGLLFGN